ncbi:hypothetical protein NMY22_g3692 [Coprinellus aureogranulatus]|nr:hypothetical protein NMY22_g3692 [Coprinellus aureogranulatus]
MATVAAPAELSLPQELVDLIVGHIFSGPGEPSASSRKDLSSLSRTAKLFLEACRQTMFKTVVLQPTIFALDGQDWKGPDTALSFGKLLAESPHLATLVQTLVYRLPFDPKDRKDQDQALVFALAKLNNVTELRFEGSEGPDPSTGFLECEREVREIRIVTGGPRASPTNPDSELLRLMQSETTKILKMRNVRVSFVEMAKIRGAETLELNNCSLFDAGDLQYTRRTSIPTDSPCLPLKHFLYKGGYGVNTHVLATDIDRYAYSGFFKIQWDGLEFLSLPIEARHFRRDTLPFMIMSSTKKLKALDMYTMNAFTYGETDDTLTLPHECPMLHLHPDSLSTLTKISFRIEFEVVWTFEVIRDPYHGLLLGGVIQKLTNLESVCIQVLIGGKRWRSMEPELLGPQWGDLDRALAPKGEEGPFPRLSRVELRVGNDGVFDKSDSRLHRKGFQNMFESNFHGLRELEREGRIALLLQIAHRWDAMSLGVVEGEHVGDSTEGESDEDTDDSTSDTDDTS